MPKSADAFRTISEVADWLGVPAHVLRFWESKFTQVKPVKRAGGRRYYRPADMQLLGGIRKLLHDDGMTIKGVQKMMRDHGVRHVAAMSPPLDADLEDAVAGIALDVTEPDEPRGQVLSFDRGAADARPDQRASAPEEDAGQTEAATPETDESAAAAASDAADPEAPEPAQPLAQGEPAPSPDAPGETAKEGPVAEEPSAPEAEPPEPNPDLPESDPAPESAHAQKAEEAEPNASSSSDPDAVSADAQAQAATPAPATPRVAAVPDDPADDVEAPPWPLGRLMTQDPALLAEWQPQLADLAGRMAELRARMDSGADRA